MVFWMGHKRQILNISKDVEQKLMDFDGFWAMDDAGPAERAGPAGACGKVIQNTPCTLSATGGGG